MFYFRRCVFMQKQKTEDISNSMRTKIMLKNICLSKCFYVFSSSHHLTVLFFVPLKTCRCWWWLEWGWTTATPWQTKSKNKEKIRLGSYWDTFFLINSPPCHPTRSIARLFMIPPSTAPSDTFALVSSVLFTMYMQPRRQRQQSMWWQNE